MKRALLIPYDKLSPEALHNLIEQFVSRDGIDSGHVQTTLRDKIRWVKSQLKCGDVVIMYDSHTQTCNIVPKDQLSAGMLHPE